MKHRWTLFFMLVTLWGSVSHVQADGKAEVAKKSQNPVADLMSLPLQYNYDSNMGPTNRGEKSVLNIQPVLPFSINDEWNLISRTILPLIDQKHMLPDGSADKSGAGDVVQSLFFSPKEPTSSGWVWGAGPVFLLPTASDDVLGSEKWGAGPTFVALRQEHGFTYGALANHIWSFAGEKNRADVNASFLQPFFAYTTKTYTTFAVNSESTYDWTSDQWSVPANIMVTQILKLGGQLLSLQVGGRYWAESPEFGPEDWGYRASVTFLFPK